MLGVQPEQVLQDRQELEEDAIHQRLLGLRKIPDLNPRHAVNVSEVGTCGGGGLCNRVCCMLFDPPPPQVTHCIAVNNLSKRDMAC